MSFPFERLFVQGTGVYSTNTYIRWRFFRPGYYTVYGVPSTVWAVWCGAGGSGGLGTSSTGIRGGGGSGGGINSGYYYPYDKECSVYVGTGGSSTGADGILSAFYYSTGPESYHGASCFGGHRGDIEGNDYVPSASTAWGVGGYYYSSTMWPGGQPNGHCGGGGGSFYSSGYNAPSTIRGGNGQVYYSVESPYSTDTIIYMCGGGGGAGETEGGNTGLSSGYPGGHGGSQTVAPTSGEIYGAGGGGAGYDSYGCS